MAKAGRVLVGGALLALVAGYEAAARGPRSLRAEYRRRTGGVTLDAEPGDVVTEADLSALPEPVAEYLRCSGAVGCPRVSGFRARMHGRIRAGAGKAAMAFTADQCNTFGDRPTRTFRMDAWMHGLPVDVLHVLADGHASMRVRLCSLLPLVHADGPDMDRAETVTLFNDLCVLAPAALVDAPVVWEAVDKHRARGVFTHGSNTVTADLVFDDRGDLVDFVSDDRLRSSSDGRSFVRQRWSTPVSGHRSFGGRRVATIGEVRWHAPAPEGEFSYLEFELDDIAYGRPDGAPTSVRSGMSSTARAGVSS